jgi:molecular chaperone GrpE
MMMDTNKGGKDEEMKKEEQNPLEPLSGDDLLDKIEQETQSDAPAPETATGNEDGLLKKLGFSKKDKHRRENEELHKSLAEEKQRADELNDKYIRLYAEFDNFRKRTLKERMELIKMAGEDVIVSLLPVLDDFGRSIKQMEATNDPMTEGVKLIFQKLITTLEKRGMKPMKSIGEPFNPDFHEAITEVAAADDSMKGKVVDEIESGYFLNDKIIRHAKVVVGK